MIQSMTHVCKRCDVEFMLEAPHYKRTWCRPCRLEYSKIHNANYTPPVKEASCLVCGIVFIGRKRDQQFCSDACRYYCPVCEPDRVAGIKRTCDECKSVKKHCLHCSMPFESRSSVQLYCSNRCREDARKPVAIELQCPWCFGNFTAFRIRCCSDSCRSAMNVHLRQYRSPDRCALPICRDCKAPHGASIEAFIVRKYRCSDCAKRRAEDATRTRYRIRDAKRRTKQRARSSAISVGDRIGPQELADRDNWMCHICDLPIDPRHNWPHPGSLTIDHIVPITPFADGQNPGTHTWDNVKAAHASCNSRRGNRPLDQAC